MAFHIHILYVTYTPYNQKAFYGTKESKQYEIYQNTSNRMDAIMGARFIFERFG